MAEGSALALCRGHATICLPIGEEEYHAIVENPKEFRRWLDRCYAEMPELFPEGFAQGYGMKDGRTSTKQGVWLRRVSLRDGRSYSVRRDKRDVWTIAYDHPQGHRTSNMLDRLMRSMNRYFDRGQHLHGSRGACDQHCRAWALLHNFAPWHPATTAGKVPPNASTGIATMTIGSKTFWSPPPSADTEITLPKIRDGQDILITRQPG